MDNVYKLYQLLDSSAETFPDATALRFQNKEITYRELKVSSEKLQHHLASIHITAGDRVAIYTHKSIDFVIALFAILKSDAAYLPIDALAPPERNSYIIKDCEAKAIIIHKTFYEPFKENYIIVTELENDLLLLKSTSEDLEKPSPDLAYILYTSGSTGNPKGVMYSHHAALQFINWSSVTFRPGNNDCFSSHAPFHFDLSIFDLFVSIKHGAKLVLISEQDAKQPLLLSRLISEEKITIWYSTPTVLTLLALYGKMEKYNYDQLRLVLFAGEVFPVNQFERLKQYWKKQTYYNLYGPTETNVCTYFKIPENSSHISFFPIGKCCEHYKSMIIENELYISGDGIMTDYWHSQKFDGTFFFTDNENTKWYKTGDLVELNEKEELIFKGRKDRMVKRNGYRIELPEIEQALHHHPGITENAVLSLVDSEQKTVIIAFVCCNLSENESIIKMKEYCIKHLPVYMIPDNFIFLKSMPQTASNKVDYQKLKQLI